jgi:hypothetical protein
VSIKIPKDISCLIGFHIRWNEGLEVVQGHMAQNVETSPAWSAIAETSAAQIKHSMQRCEPSFGGGGGAALRPGLPLLHHTHVLQMLIREKLVHTSIHCVQIILYVHNNP